MTINSSLERRSGTGVFIPACMLQDSPSEDSADESAPYPAEQPDIRRSSSFRTSVDYPPNARRSFSCSRASSQYNAANTHYSSPLPACDDTLAARMYQQSSLYSSTMPAPHAAPSAPRPPASSCSAGNRTTRRCSVESTGASRRTTRRYSVDSVSLRQWSNACMPSNGASSANNSCTTSANACSPYQSALYAPAGSVSPPIPGASRSPATSPNGTNPTRRISVDLHNMRAAGVGMVGAVSPQAYDNAPYPVARRSFEVNSHTMSGFSNAHTTPLPAPVAPPSPYMLQQNPNPNPNPTHGLSAMQLQQQQHNGLMHCGTVSPAAIAEETLDTQIHTVLMDILDLGSQLAAAADAAGVGALPVASNCSSRYSLDQSMMPYYAEAPYGTADLAVVVEQQQQQLQMPMQPCSMASAAVAASTMSPRNSLDLLLLQQQQQQILASADISGMTAQGLVPAAAVGSGLSAFQLDSIDEDPVDLTAYFARHQQQKMKHQAFVTAASGHGSPTYGTSPPNTGAAAAAMLNAQGSNCNGLAAALMSAGGLCNQLNAESAGYTSSLRPEAQAKLQELMAAQQLQLEIQNELLTMLSSA